jgi:hypothetical protein
MPVSRTLLNARIEIPRVDGVRAPPRVLPAEADGFEVKRTLQGDAVPKAAREAKVLSFGSSSLLNAQGKPRWRGPGDTVRFEMLVRWNGDARKMPLAPAVYTNANHNDSPRIWRAHKMRFEKQDGDRATFVIDLPIWRLGNYRATGVILDGDRPALWASKRGIRDLVFRPYAVEHDRMIWNLVNIMNLGKPDRIGTFEDLLGDGSPETNGTYTLRAMAEDGVDCVRLLPVQPREASPYSKTAMFEVWAQYSKPAQEIEQRINKLREEPPSAERDGKLDELKAARFRAALRSLLEFIKQAQALGIRTVLDVVPNHVGKNLRVQDAFFTDEDGQPVDLFDPNATATRLEIRRNDGSQLAVGAGSAAAIERRIASGAANLQDAAPHIFGKWLDAHGARNKHEIADGGWFEWKKPGTWQLNHGTFRYDYRWFDHAQSAETERTRAYVLREMAFWILLGIDGFRIDHGTGLPWIFYQEDLNLLQAVADRYRPGLKIYIETEDFHTHDKTKPCSDTTEQGGFRALLGAVGPAQIRAAFDAPWRQNSSADAGNQDEGSAMRAFGGDWQAYARFMALECLLGGPNGRKMGDEFGEKGGLDFRGNGSKLWTLSKSNDVTKHVHKIIARAGRAKRHIEALHHRNRHWLMTTSGKWHEDLLVAARSADPSELDRGHGSLAIVAANFHGARRRRDTFRLTRESAALLDDHERYMAFNHMAHDKDRWLWASPISGRDIKKHGIYIELQPYQVQALDLAAMEKDGEGRWRIAERPRDEPPRPIPPSIRILDP